MPKNRLFRLWWGGIALILLGGFAMTPSVFAQDQCGFADAVQYPIDTTQFDLVQNFAIASPRHQGRYHTGEDWFYANGQIPGRSLGQPVQAVANGLVVLSSPTAWGVDGGVVIIRHQLPNGNYFFTQYGHIAETDDIQFPSRLSCVTKGQVLAVIGDARPAPHLHFEIRVYVAGSDSNPGDNPGPGYTREHPYDLGYRQPMAYITNLQAQLSDYNAWQFVGRAVEPQPAPLLLNDNSLLHVDDGVLRRLTWDGRALWRVEQTRTPIHLFGYQANSYLVTGDGGVHLINLETGKYEQSWNLDFLPIGEPVKMDGGWIYPSMGDELVAVSDDHRTIVWRKSDIPAFTSGIATLSLMGFVGVDNQLWMLSSRGDVLHRADLRSGARFSGGASGGIIAYTWGGIWSISSSAEWSLIVNHPSNTTDGWGVMTSDDGRIFITTRDTLQIYAPTGELSAQMSLPASLLGRVSLARYNDIIFMMSSEGLLLALREDGLICGELRVQGEVYNPYHWQAMGSDDILRLRVGNLTMGLNWSEFIEGC